jgi:acetylornithine deacetylase
MKTHRDLTQEAISLLEALIETPSFSTEEEKTAL